MINQIVATIFTTIILGMNTNGLLVPEKENVVLSEKEFSLENRYAVKSVNDIMKKNILLNLAYLNGTVTKKSDIDWDQVTSPFHFEKTLKVGETFAYHTNVRKEYTDKVTFTTNSNFNAADGYLSDGYLFGDGVCHLASLINWAALEAGLETIVPKDHRSVGPIPQVPDEYGVSIYKNQSVGANNNLYVTNTKTVPVTLHFDYDGTNLKVYVTEAA
ncbi:MAG: VanW family protein [Microgenomates group bacterium]